MSPRRLTAAAAVGAVLLLTGPHAAADPGHGPEAAPVSAEPAPNSTVTSEVDEAILSFNVPLANLQGHQLIVTGPDGQRVDDGEVTLASPQTLRVGLNAMKERGQYTVRYSALAAGAQPSGTYRFTYNGPVGGSPVQKIALGAVLLSGVVIGGVALKRSRARAA